MSEMEDPTPSPHYEGRFLPEVEAVLREAGWFPGRVVPMEQLKQWLVIEWELENGFRMQRRMFSAAWRILREFGGLDIHQNSPGVTCRRESFCFDPPSGWWTDEWFVDEWEADGALFPLGVSGYYSGTDVFFFAVTGQGKIINNDGQLIGNTIEEALTNLIVGHMPETYESPRDKFLEASYLRPFLAPSLYPQTE